MSKWIDINGYEGLYQVNERGEIYSVRSNKVLKPFYRGSRPDNKYLVVDLNKNSNRKTVSVHRIVAEAFISNPDNLPCVNHIDGNKDNNCVENLEWCTHLDNNNHAIKNGLKKYKSGTANKNSKLTYDDVVAIKKCLILGDSRYGTRPLARKYDVDHNIILDIYHNRKYQDVKIPYTYFVSSDIHSAYTPWMDALAKAGFNKNKYSHKIAICGDLFDRMDETVRVYEFVKEMAKQDRLIYVTGNHESLLFDCMAEIYRGQVPSGHHFSNGTVKTICQFCGQSEWIIYDPTWRDQIYETMKPVLDFISDNCVNYAEIGDFTLVHGWIPVIQKDNLPKYYINHQKFEFNPDWRDASSQEWERARWLNGMDMWKYVGHPDDTTVICGHWHCSYGWSHLRQQYKEWPQPSHADWGKSFEPFIDNGIIAIDACTAYSGKCNVIVIEEDKINGDN